MISVFENIYSDQPFYLPVSKALDRIKNGKSKARIEEIRKCLDKEKADAIKRQLPSVCFSGKFSRREDAALLEHSGFMILDFDNVASVEEKIVEITDKDFVYACWLSPRGNGLKALVKIADGSKHREHFQALQDVFPEIDRSGVNISRVCYESYDPHIYINTKAKPFAKIKSVERVEVKETVYEHQAIFQNLLKWLSNRNDAFVTGERNFFIFKLASACCRFGLNENSAQSLILAEYPASNDFTDKECRKAILSAYRANKGKSGTASFDRDVLVDKTTRRELEIDTTLFDENGKTKDVVYGEDVKEAAIDIYKNGFASVLPLGIPLDDFFKRKRKEITLISGIGNYGKSAFHKWEMLMRVLKYGEKFASFSPEDNPPEEYYHDFVEMLLGCDMTPLNHSRPSIDVYNAAFDFVSKHIFYVYPKDLTPTPDYIKERFLELIFKEKVDGVTIDPFNQLANDYTKSGGRTDKYLETFLSDFSRFTQANNVYGTIIAHPHKMQKQGDGNYPCPDVFDLADGAMWNNKMDNILIYHRPFMQVSPEDPTAEFHSKKIKRQKTVGKRGFILMEYVRRTRRFEFSGYDYMAKLIAEKDLTFGRYRPEIKEVPMATNYFEPIKEGEPF